jgi:hypothetical protein
VCRPSPQPMSRTLLFESRALFFKNFYNKIGRLGCRPAVLSGLIGLCEVTLLSCVKIHKTSLLETRRTVKWFVGWISPETRDYVGHPIRSRYFA